jgi:membrane-associated phospholipid phosphatase
MGRLARLVDSWLAQGIHCLLNVYLVTRAAYEIQGRWHKGGFPLGASIFAAVAFGLLALFCAKRAAIRAR